MPTLSNSVHPQVQRGELYWLDWNPARGSEQAGRRPALVIQENAASSNPNYPLTIVAAVSTHGRSVSTHIALQPSSLNGLSSPCFVKCEQLQTVSKTRLIQLIGRLDEAEMDHVDLALKKALALP